MFQPAKRERLKALVAMAGASGSGKTFSSLVLAKGIIKGMYPDLDEKDKEFWSKIAVLDTEHNRSKIYADMEKHGIYFGSFLHSNMTKPFTHDKYIEAIENAQKAGVEVLILDSTTHLWKEILEEQQELGGRYQDWKEPSKKYEQFIEAFTQSDIHIIATMRAKQAYALEPTETGKLEVAKLGEKPVQRDDFEYEFLISFLFDQEHYARTTKDNTPLFEPLGRFKITEEHGADLVKWLDKGEDVIAKRQKEREEKEKELEYKKELVSTIHSYTKTDNKVMNEYAHELISRGEKATGKGKLHLFPQDRLENLLKLLDDKYTLLVKDEKQREETTLAELKKVAKSFNIKGYTKMKKDELIAAIEKAQKEPTA